MGFRGIARAAVLGLLVCVGGAVAGDAADPTEFYRRLESIGLSTEYLRRLVGKIELFFEESSDVAEASYGYLTDNVYIPPTLREEGSARIRFDLEANHISTLIHELTHADNDVMASETAASGTPERIHWNAMQTIWADLFNDPKHKFLGMSRYPRMKADEVCGYFMGKSMTTLFWAVGDIVLYNTVLGGSKVTSADEARRLGSTLILPPAGTTNGWEQRVLRIRFGESSVYDEARFQSSGISGANLIHWDETGRDWLKRDMYRGILGLDPPADMAELLRRLNTIDNAWVRDLRDRVSRARAASLATVTVGPPGAAAGQAADGSQGVLGQGDGAAPGR